MYSQPHKACGGPGGAPGHAWMKSYQMIPMGIIRGNAQAVLICACRRRML
ncbi:hypothetical protein L541_4363 [Bordetella hinzii CA90 BAL1384]|uniref:Uncharacterized protein n=1 Tax=Bordetella hinzii OH87 BAL007II TaxID=1331262 RepID=A0ABR4R816_9BORD|nr:hypothetical protein L543_2862 [Bordetella hinzii L60]KCB26548.1 hypothetical protein L544_3060 [Bordetella hinzii OH87 BAL007II]KCB34394.1 hypothetical protein L541_4363 [Bordetella hinzii CA90 BAL1384]KCB41070.1 hypothetical protein L539_3353 [Bordetella hinzii 5132]KCB47368.1 hypothetical protein L538_1040 [Bordetella hinzii 4161]KCB50003.1 hypothetical protein L537_0676 [Bordetella hinzii 1277]